MASGPRRATVRGPRDGAAPPEAVVTVDDDELREAFQFFDTRGTGKITVSDLKKRLAPFYRGMPTREYKFLMGNEKELTLSHLRDLLLDNEITGFDPVAEAFKVYDPDGTGYADVGIMKDIFESLGFDELSKEDIEILIETADKDRDGRISLDDFRALLSNTRPAKGTRLDALTHLVADDP